VFEQPKENKQTIIAQGKTKIIREWPDDANLVLIESKDDITAHNALKHDVLPEKAKLATQTTVNVFRLLKACGIPVAFERQISPNTFLAQHCVMIPYEVVVRRQGHGSFIKRNPYIKKGEIFPKLVTEFFLKTTGNQWQGVQIPKDDPLIQFADNKAKLYLPDVPLWNQQPFMQLDEYPLHDKQERFETMRTIACKTFLILENAWRQVGCALADFKIEFGFDTNNNLLLADVIDNDSWRVVHDNNYIDKQVYRDGGALDTVGALYQRVASLTAQFVLTKQRIIIWRGSDKDDIITILQSTDQYKNYNVSIDVITASMHKEPAKCYHTLQKITQETPDCVIIALIGRSNGAGPTLAANTTVPVITVPVGWEKLPEDVWSSLRGPSQVPVMTVLDQSNALLAASNILAIRNCALYAQLRMEQEKRHVNYVLL
jgi:phosphoribosylaminoimidazole carboxylase/phosphoribosylaminoimidazole-succinocarboxamide synthase